MEKDWQVEAIEIEGKKRIAISFPYRKDWVAEIRQWKGAIWNSRLRCWHVQDNAYYRHLLGVEPKLEAFETGNTEKLSAEKTEQIRQFIRYMRSKNYSTQTIKTYTEAIRCFLQYFPDKTTTAISNLDVIDFNNDYIIAKKLSYSYQNQLVNAIKLFYGSI